MKKILLMMLAALAAGIFILPIGSSGGEGTAAGRARAIHTADYVATTTTTGAPTVVTTTAPAPPAVVATTATAPAPVRVLARPRLVARPTTTTTAPRRTACQGGTTTTYC